MPVELVIAPEAELDIAEACVWYEARRAGLGEEFLSSVDACLESIRRGPGMYQAPIGRTWCSFLILPVARWGWTWPWSSCAPPAEMEVAGGDVLIVMGEHAALRHLERMLTNGR
jgi:hypothetical protein